MRTFREIDNKCFGENSVVEKPVGPPGAVVVTHVDFLDTRKRPVRLLCVEQDAVVVSVAPVVGALYGVVSQVVGNTVWDLLGSCLRSMNVPERTVNDITLRAGHWLFLFLDNEKSTSIEVKQKRNLIFEMLLKSLKFVLKD